jgi:hypothetical protein
VLFSTCMPNCTAILRLIIESLNEFYQVACENFGVAYPMEKFSVCPCQDVCTSSSMNLIASSVVQIRGACNSTSK